MKRSRRDPHAVQRHHDRSRAAQCASRAAQKLKGYLAPIFDDRKRHWHAVPIRLARPALAGQRSRGDPQTRTNPLTRAEAVAAQFRSIFLTNSYTLTSPRRSPAGSNKAKDITSATQQFIMASMTNPKDMLKPVKRRRPWWFRILRTLALLYIVMILGACMFQEHLIFPAPPALMACRSSSSTPPKDAQLITLQTASGKKAVAIFGPALTPQGDRRPDAATCPSILYFYGNGMCLADTVDFEFPEFRRMGCNVMVVEYLGYGMSEGDPTEKGCYEAADAGYAALLAHQNIDPRHIITGGWSLGGAIALHIAATHQVCGLFMFSSFTSMTEVAQSHYPFLPVTLLLKYPIRTIDIIGTIKVPILIGHGTADDLVPYRMAETMKAAAKASPSVTLFNIEGASHNDFYTLGQSTIFQELATHVPQVRCGPVKISSEVFMKLNRCTCVEDKYEQDQITDRNTVRRWRCMRGLGRNAPGPAEFPRRALAAIPCSHSPRGGAALG